MVERRHRGLKLAAAAGIALALKTGYYPPDFGRNGRPDKCTSLFQDKPEKELNQQKDSFHNPFSGKEANRVANELGVTAGNFWVTDADVLKNIRKSSETCGYLVQSKLLPIFPAAVMEQSEIIERVSKEIHIPVNVIATIASIESAGKVKADSGVARGLFQVVPGYHLDKIVKVAEEEGFDIKEAKKALPEWRRLVEAGRSGAALEFGNNILNATEALENPYIGCKVGMMVLQDDFEAVIEGTGLNRNSPVAWARALGAYNGGLGNASAEYYSKPFESQIYEVHGIRYLMIAEIAAQMRNRGLSDKEIAKQLVSKELDARAWAFYQTADGRVGQRIGPYEHLWDALALPTIDAGDDTQLTAEMRAAYNAHMSGEHVFDLPLSAGLRMWLVHGGLSLFNQTPYNKDPNNYAANK